MAKKLIVMGNCYSDTKEKADELFGALESAGYTLGYNSMNSTSVVVMKEVEEQPDAEE